MRRLGWILLLCTPLACASGSEPSDAGDGPEAGDPADAGVADATDPSDSGDASVLDVAPKCTAGTSHGPGAAAFREVTEAWGLVELGVQGIRLSTVDFDGDGWSDLIVRSGGNTPDDFSAEGVRRTWLLRNDRGQGFVDVTVQSGLRATRNDQGDLGRPGEVFAFGDVDNDGDLDVYTGLNTGDPNVLVGETSELLLNDGSGNFSLGPTDSPIRNAGGVDVVAGATFVDVDRDGALDLWVTHNAYDGSNGTEILQDRLFMGAGDGTFVDETLSRGLETQPWAQLSDLNGGRAHSRAWSAVACDLNDDGAPELLAGSYGRAPNHLWQSSADGRSFTNRSVDSGYAYDDNLEWGDNEFARCYCAASPAAAGCAEVGPPRITCSTPNWNHGFDREPFRLGGNSGTAVCADIDNDGHFDLLTTEITHWWAGSGADLSSFLHNLGESDVRFERKDGPSIGLERPHFGISWDQGDMTGAVFDFDNDRWPDLYIGASDYPGNFGLLYRQTSAGQFVLLPVEEYFEHNRSHGLAVADFDHDGDLDLIVGHSRSRCDATAPHDCYPTRQVRFFENLAGDGGNWIQLDLVGGPSTNRKAIGARVMVEVDGVTQTQEVGGGHGHYGIQHDLVLHFGLGPACVADVTVRWPDAEGSTQTFQLVSGYRYQLRQGELPVPLTAD